MTKYIILLCLVVITTKNYSQELYLSYDISYKKDMEKIKVSYKKTFNSFSDRMTANDTVNIDREKEALIKIIMMALPETIGDLSNNKHLSLTISDSIITEKKVLLNDSIIEKILKPSKLKNLYQDEINLVEIQEDTADVKVINGYKCHKIYLKVIEDKRMPELSTINYEIYVTDKIKFLYNPVIRFKSILEKYLPMEIIKRHKEYEGLEIIHHINKIKI